MRNKEAIKIIRKIIDDRKQDIDNLQREMNALDPFQQGQEWDEMYDEQTGYYCDIAMCEEVIRALQ